MYKVDVPVDPAIEKGLVRRRSAETARKARIFDTRQRVMGIDLDALNQQVKEKKHLQSMELQRDKAFDKLRMYHDEALLQQDIDEREKRAVLHNDLTQHWATRQRAEDSRDADLKCDLKGAYHISMPVEELGPASMQMFQEEDIRVEERRRAQMKKTERDLRTQKEDKEIRHMRDKHTETLMCKELEHQDFRGVQLHALEEEFKKASRIALDNYNEALAVERAEKLNEQRRREDRENFEEKRHTLTCDMMTERAEAAELGVGGGRPTRVLVDKWKGMNPEQINTIHKEREEQRLQRQRQRDADKVQDAAWDLQQLKLSRQAEEQERREAELRREKKIQTDHYNMHLAREQQAYREYLNKKVYTNKPTKDYFCQFNTSSR